MSMSSRLPGGDYQKYVLDFFPIIVNSACPLDALILTP